MRIMVIVNPRAGGGRARKVVPVLEETLRRAGAEFVCFVADGVEQARELAGLAVAQELDLVAAVGGDGTVREIAGVLVGSRTALGIVPAGTGNGTAYSLGVPLSPAKACRVLVEGRGTYIDVGRVGRGHFLNVAGVGLDAYAAEEAARNRYLAGVSKYIYAAVKSYVRYSAPQMRIVVDEETVATRALLVVVGNGSYYGSGVRIVPGALPGDGRLDVCVVDELDWLDLASVVPLLLLGRHTRHRAFRLRRARQVRVEADRPVRVHADGDLVGTTPAVFDVLPGAIQVVLARGAAAIS